MRIAFIALCLLMAVVQVVMLVSVLGGYQLSQAAQVLCLASIAILFCNTAFMLWRR